MARRRFAGAQGCGQLRVHAGVALNDAGIVHHFAQPDYGVPVHGAADVLRPDFRAGVLETGHGGHAGRRCYEHFQRRARRVLHNGLHARKAHDVADLMRVGEHGRRPVRHGGAGVLPRRDHGRLQVHVPVHEAGREVFPARVHHFGIRADTVRRVAHKRDPACGDRHAGMRQDLARTDVDQPRVRNHKFRRLLAGRDGRELFRTLPQRGFPKSLRHCHTAFPYFPRRHTPHMGYFLLL